MQSMTPLLVASSCVHIHLHIFPLCSLSEVLLRLEQQILVLPSYNHEDSPW